MGERLWTIGRAINLGRGNGGGEPSWLDGRGIIPPGPVQEPKSIEAAWAPMPLPVDAAARKAVPLATGLLDYFPDALAAVASLSKVANEQHHPGEPLHWDRAKSADHPDCLMRHLMERGTIDTDGQRHSAKVAWRALALLQEEIEADRDAGA